MKRANLYRRGDGWYISAMSQTTVGLWIGTDPHLKERSNDSAILGGAILTALDGSRQAVPHPTKWGNTFRPVLELAGVKTWDQFMRKAKCVSIAATDENIAIEPSKNSGPETGYTPLAERDLLLPIGSTPREIGDAVKHALTLCE